MFRRSKAFPDDHRHGVDYSCRDDFFGDEDGAARVARLDALDGRVGQIEAQISSQFTSLATYSQIAQEQTELVRAEARHETGRNTARVIALIDQERAERLAASHDADLGERLTVIEDQIAEIHTTLQQCLASQEALVDAVAGLMPRPLTEPPPMPPAPRAARVQLALA